MSPRKDKRFQYACFISYRHGQGELIKDFIEELTTAIENRLGLLGHPLKVFVDKERLKPSYSVDPGLAEAICKSVCMIVVYNNGYFDTNSPFCAREFCAMVDLEGERLRSKKLPKKLNLIIPILLRHPEKLPSEIFDRNPCDLSEIYTNPEKHFQILKMKKKLNQSALEIAYPKEMEKIAGVIDDMYRTLTADGDDLCGDCIEFEFPADKEVNKLLKKTAYIPAFPIGTTKP